ncbi:hypothetical protein SAMN06265795_104284 [Noviherbaspirillum humi]|uniref:Uncharacterized protein n=1 Tax=Noviherbaspirillum humi TaxID=1688639 RepID=A0A239G7D2_9BURK|nr:hypothetical protein SAMN06265795_104284 [Noviherbaspirillum humi]
MDSIAAASGKQASDNRQYFRMVHEPHVTDIIDCDGVMVVQCRWNTTLPCHQSIRLGIDREGRDGGDRIIIDSVMARWRGTGVTQLGIRCAERDYLAYVGGIALQKCPGIQASQAPADERHRSPVPFRQPPQLRRQLRDPGLQVAPRKLVDAVLPIMNLVVKLLQT